ncbi:TRAP transporter small permease subunit [Aquamicrobium sp. LC103]|uniref:TRAP transporter small permease subunit n=1 Tax=Aquamicrobium sp. LC103 TaxID=1120658 RepID=UPI00063E82A5|nr:TRAP transporter small permease subunit [Aquamicrobium sp. LC103]TKT76244.1 TRAP transporter small permease [Aquamicrobium sp. LC103]
MWQSIYRMADAVSRVLAYISGAAILSIALMQIAEIVLRNAVGVSLHFVWEYAAYFHMGAVFLGAAFTLRTGGHIQVTILKGLNPRLFGFMSTLVGLAISAFLSYSLVMLAYGYGISGRTSGTTNNVPLLYPAMFVAFGAVMLTLQLFLRLVHLTLGTKEELPWHGSALAE